MTHSPAVPLPYHYGKQETAAALRVRLLVVAQLQPALGGFEVH